MSPIASGIKITAFTRALKPEIELFKREFADYLKSGVFAIDQINRYLAKTRGKALRPIVAFLAAKSVGEASDKTMKAALVVELLHNATLVHDDVVDGSDMRRGLPSIKKIWSGKIAVLYGDYLLAHSLRAMLDLRDFVVFDILSDTARRLARGELAQAIKARELDITEEVYLQMISDKTAALISASAELGALTAGGDDEARQKLKIYGENLGMAFQIRDDMLDYTGREGLLGKPIGGDLKEKKITLPLIHALKNAGDKRRRDIIAAVKKRKGLNKVVKFVREGDGIEYTRNKAREYTQAAQDCLADFPDSETKDLLIGLADFAVSREK